MVFPPVGRVLPGFSPIGTHATRMSKLDSYRSHLVKEETARLADHREFFTGSPKGSLRNISGSGFWRSQALGGGKQPRNTSPRKSSAFYLASVARMSFLVSTGM
jgi:hypothetical protein